MPTQNPKSHLAPSAATLAEDCILVLQGGGALGAYQAGVFESLSRVYKEPSWVAGISIGAINAALIAGNAANKRVERLHEFWDLVSSSSTVPGANYGYNASAREAFNESAASQGMWFGVPGFFSPRFPPAPFQPRGTLEAISFYDTAPLLMRSKSTSFSSVALSGAVS